jgi:hypothetical protein
LSSHARNHQRWGERGIYVRGSEPADEETIIDSYILAMSMRLGNRFPARLVRQAIPAARCLHVLSQWFPLFATWFSDMPNKCRAVQHLPLADCRLSPLSSRGLYSLLAGISQLMSGGYNALLDYFVEDGRWNL